MAYMFSLSAECGNLRENAETFSLHFQDLILTLSDKTEAHCSSGIFQDLEGNWWSLVNPKGVVAGLIERNAELCKAVRTTEIGFLLYEHLKTAPPFRFAMVGWEVDEFRNASEIDSDDLKLFNGLVLSQEFCDRLNCRSELEMFASKYYWQPYQGERKEY